MNTPAVIEITMELMNVDELLDRCRSCIDTSFTPAKILNKKILEETASYLFSQRYAEIEEDSKKEEISSFFKLLSNAAQERPADIMFVPTKSVERVTANVRNKILDKEKNKRKVEGSKEAQERAQRMEDFHASRKSPYSLEDFMDFVKLLHKKFELPEEFVTTANLKPVLNVLLSEKVPRTIANAVLHLRNRIDARLIPVGVAHSILTTAKIHNATVRHWSEKLTALLPEADSEEKKKTRWKMRELDK